MSDSTMGHTRGSRHWAVPAMGAVLLWRVAAVRWPSPFVEIPEGLHVGLALLGGVFLLSGCFAWWLRPSRESAIFLVYGLGGGIHWGGAIGTTHATIAMSFFFLYLGMTALGDAALLHLALVYPRERALSRGLRVALYLPAACSLPLALSTAFVPHEWFEPLGGAILLVANLFSLVGGILFVIRTFTVDPVVRRAARLPWITAAMLLGSGFALLGAGGLLPGEPESWNLALGVIPLTLAVALASPSLGSLPQSSSPPS